jgi:hypothetical protein
MRICDHQRPPQRKETSALISTCPLRVTWSVLVLFSKRYSPVEADNQPIAEITEVWTD